MADDYENSPPLTLKERLVIGGVAGALATTGIYSSDSTYLSILMFNDIYQSIGFFGRILIGVGAGAFWLIYLHRQENNPKRAFELGLMAPALVSGLLAAHGPSQSEIAAMDLNPLVSTAWAQATPAPTPSPFDRIVRGLLGR
ncbi:MAG: hypothetical protein O2944_08185 [Proteobacteria bacterium]|nr:hypothetical protein [Pseudomonadota bacterium]